MKVRKVEATSHQRTKKKKVAAYCRVSTGRCEQEESLEIQQSYYTAYIKGNSEWEFAGIYSDTRSGLSADKREGFMQMMEDAYDGKIDIILCKSISRFSRNIIECQRYTSELSSRNIIVIFEKEHLRTDEPTSNLIFSLMCAIAQDESRSISENLKTAIRHRVEAGDYTPHQNLILGYDVRDGKYVPNQDAEVIRMIFGLYASGKGIADICNQLNLQGIHRKTVGEPFTHQVIQKILSNETYVGDKKLQKDAPKDFLTKKPDKEKEYITNYVSDDHEAIISRDTWDKVQLRLKDEKIERDYRVRHCSRSHEYYGKVFCGCCGSPYQRRMKNTNSPNPAVPKYSFVWECKERIKGHKGNGCKNVIIKEETLEYFFDQYPDKVVLIKEPV